MTSLAPAQTQPRRSVRLNIKTTTTGQLNNRAPPPLKVPQRYICTQHKRRRSVVGGDTPTADEFNNATPTAAAATINNNTVHKFIEILTEDEVQKELCNQFSVVMAGTDTPTIIPLIITFKEEDNTLSSTRMNTHVYIY
jgi:hypothetical protein